MEFNTVQGGGHQLLDLNFSRVELLLPLRGFRQFVAFTYIGCNLVGLLANSWVLFVVGPLLWLSQVRVPKSILFHILALCISDLATMSAMILLNLEIFYGSWRFGAFACRAYLLFDSLNKFSAPVIVLLISRTCYATVCLDNQRQQRAASLRLAVLQVLVSLVIVLCLLWPLFVYSHVAEIVVRVNKTARVELFVRKCAFVPPPNVELVFNLVVSSLCYAIPFCGFLYWYASVPFFLWRRKDLLSQNLSLSSVKGPQPAGAKHPCVAVIRRVVITVVCLAVIYLLCWTPYWMGMYAQRLFRLKMTKHNVIVMYFLHLMPYVSCAAYPAIFTLFNRPIRSAHSQWRRSMQRRFLEGSQLAQTIREAMTMTNSHSTHSPAQKAQEQRRKRVCLNSTEIEEETTLRVDKDPRDQR